MTVEYAAVAQLVEHVLGKDEVKGSSPLSSSSISSGRFRWVVGECDFVFWVERRIVLGSKNG